MIELSTLLNALIWLAILGGICWVLWWLCGQFPEPFAKVGRIIVAIVAVILLVNFLLGLMGSTPLIRIR